MRSRVRLTNYLMLAGRLLRECKWRQTCLRLVSQYSVTTEFAFLTGTLPRTKLSQPLANLLGGLVEKVGIVRS